MSNHAADILLAIAIVVLLLFAVGELGAEIGRLL